MANGVTYIPTQVIEDKQIKTPTALITYLALVHLDQNGEHNLSYKDIGALTGQKAFRTIKKAVEELESIGLIEVMDNGKGFAPTYKVNYTPEEQSEIDEEMPEVEVRRLILPNRKFKAKRKQFGREVKQNEID